jgi:hypothetical protein
MDAAKTPAKVLTEKMPYYAKIGSLSLGATRKKDCRDYSLGSVDKAAAYMNAFKMDGQQAGSFKICPFVQQAYG